MKFPDRDLRGPWLHKPDISVVEGALYKLEAQASTGVRIRIAGGATVSKEQNEALMRVAKVVKNEARGAIQKHCQAENDYMTAKNHLDRFGNYICSNPFIVAFNRVLGLSDDFNTLHAQANLNLKTARQNVLDTNGELGLYGLGREHPL